ncbi:PadR family transcriptional regulator [Acidothermaceae bacterium B102]|nr:PadR family transcriptional regulator [Acidothermaceae bacterium B102]
MTAMSATRLLVLGVIRIQQPVHAYDVRRELLTWRLEENTNVKPGSIYGAVRTLERDGCIAVHSRESEDSRPERTSYVLTEEGEKEFQFLLRQSWWRLDLPAEPLIPALSMMMFMSRDELVGALGSRIESLGSHLKGLAFTRETIRDGATGADGTIPEHVREIIDFMTARAKSEQEWTKGLQRRLRAGTYTFAEERPYPPMGPYRGWRGPVDEVET